ncbi:MAG: hypothetical protein CW691_05395 [Candidatus Bathyarchaeum sp.]|nr:MAG: hypothetical protein CW691_05395 [Candidatus Bathyarchaeum sp.]
MKILKTKSKTATIALLLVLTISVFAASVQLVSGYETFKTYGFVAVTPNPVQINQQVLVTFRVDKNPPTATGITGDFWENLNVHITKPDGTEETLGPFTADATGGSWTLYYPNQLGTYTFQMTWPGDWVNTTAYERWYTETESSVVELLVQEEPIENPSNPAPTNDYWERPIFGENKGWWQISDSWLMEGYDYTTRNFAGYTALAPYTSAPESAHVLWTKELTFGGVVGGKYEDQTFYTGLSYEQLYAPLIVNGRIIYDDNNMGMSKGGGTFCVDLYTGEEIWYLSDVTIDFAQLLDYDSPNEHGILAYLWDTAGTTWHCYDAFTGEFKFSIENVPSGTIVFGPKGELMVYNVVANYGSDWYVYCWNQTKVVGDDWSYPARSSPASSGGVCDGSTGYEYNVTVPTAPEIIPPSERVEGALAFGHRWDPADVKVEDGYILAEATISTGYPWTILYIAYDMETGEELWTATTQIEGQYIRKSQNIEDDVFTLFDEPLMQLYGYDMKTGNKIWTTPTFGTGWGAYSRDFHLAYGKAYTAGFDGYVRAYSLTDGSLEWEYYFGSSGYETPSGTYSVYNGFTLADGMIYVANDEHSPDSVLPRGARTVCLNAETGDLIWDISGGLVRPVIADGYLTACNTYDNMIYTIGKGPSATTVSAPQTAVDLDTAVVLTGTVTDQSPAQPGTPAVSDESMTGWMEYLHQQGSCPADVTGVPVTLTAIDPNGNSQTIGTVTTDAGGSYGIMWTPPVEGLYQITATFDGTDSYGSSYATTYLGVGPAVSAATPIEPDTETPDTETPDTETPDTETPDTETPDTETPTTEAPLISTEVAIIAAVAVACVIGVAAFWALRKRK